MRQRCTGVKAKSGPVAPRCCFSREDTARPNPTDNAKNGSVGSTSCRQRMRPRCHQHSSRTTAGRENAVTLAVSAARNQTSAPKYQRTRRGRGGGGAVGRWPPETGETSVAEKGGEVEHEREDVLALGDPSDGLHHHRMEREDRRRQCRAGHVQPPQQPPEEEGSRRVQGDVFEVIRQGPVAPQVRVQPEGRPAQWIVLLEGGWHRPHLPEAVPVAQKIGDEGGPGIVVPEELAVPCGSIRREGRSDQKHGQNPGTEGSVRDRHTEKRARSWRTAAVHQSRRASKTERVLMRRAGCHRRGRCKLCNARWYFSAAKNAAVDTLNPSSIMLVSGVPAGRRAFNS